MKEELDAILADARAELAEVKERAGFESYKAGYVGPKGRFTQVSKSLGKLPKEERPTAGKLINEAKQAMEAILAEGLERIEIAEMEARMGPPIDPTLPPPGPQRGLPHPLSQVRDEICSIFRRAGFVIAEGPEMDTEFYCFDSLNFQPDHPARDMQDSYFPRPETRFANVKQRESEPYVMRTHTSTVQIRTMMDRQPPLRIVSPGRCFRRDTADATHSANFHQIEGLYVDRKVTVKDLKAILDYFVQSILGKDSRTRLRPSYFPFTEPSYEVDVASSHLKKVGADWIEIMGCGMVDPAVFTSVGYDPEEWTGYAFGMGVERIAMLLYGVDDIRNFYQNDVRFLEQFS